MTSPTEPKPKVTIFDGPNKIKKRWTIGIAAIVGLLQTFAAVPEYIPDLINVIAGVFYGS